MSVSQFTAVLVLVAALPLALLAIFMYLTMLSNARQTARDNLMGNARALGALVEFEIDTHVAVAATLATSESLQRNDLESFRARARQALQTHPGTWLDLVDPSGAVVLSTLDRQTPAPRVTVPAITNAFTSLQPQVSDIVMDSASPRPAAFVAVPVLKDGVAIYVIAVALNPENLHTVLQIRFEGNPAIGVIDRQHRFLARTPDHDRRLGTLAAQSWRAAIARAASGVYETVTLEGTPSFTAYVTTRDGWIAGLSYPREVVDGPARSILRLVLPLGLIALGMSGALGLILSRRLSHAMGSLAKSAELVGHGATVDAKPLQLLEADAIAAALSTTSHDLAERARQLQRARDTFFNLVQHAPFGVYLVDSQLRLAQVSAGAEAAFRNVRPLLGRDLGEALRILWPERFASEAIARFRHTLATGESYRQSALIELRKDSGEPESYDWQIERVTLPNGEHGVVCYYYDLTPQMRAEAALRASEGRFRSTFENAAVGVAHVELDGRLREVNERLAGILGYPREELVGRPFQELTHPEDLAADLDNLGKLRAGECASYSIDKRYMRKDGLFVWTGLTVSMQRTALGEPDYYIKVVRDITDRKEAEAHQQFLLRELAHRMKNQLAVIQAMAGQTVRSSGSLPEFQKLFSQRIQGLAVATDALLAQGWTGALLEQLVDLQLRPFAPSAARLVCDGPRVSISPDATEAIGLALHELATNCVKHGAWSVASGTVAVRWRIEAGHSPPIMRLSWQEHGGPHVVSPTRSGFGRVVIERMVAQKVGGEAEVQFAAGGLSWTVTVPAVHFTLV